MVQLGLKSRSRRVVQDSPVPIQKPNLGTDKLSGEEDEGIGVCWNNLPSEMLREILMKVEESGSKWPARKSVVACAGVCRNWRKVMKEIVTTPELSGKLTFPISIKQPGPRDSLLQCFIQRNRSTQMYYLFASCSEALADDGKFLLSARRCKRPTCTDYLIYLHPDGTPKGGDCYIGKLRSNFLGRKFVVYDVLPPCSDAKMVKSRSMRTDSYTENSHKVSLGNYPVAHVSYELNVLEARGPRRLQCIMDAIPDSSIRPGGVAPTQTHFPITGITSSPAFPFFRTGSSYFDKSPFRSSTSHGDKSLFLRNKPPRWHEQFQCWCLNFHGRVTLASVKNFQLVACPGNNGESGPEHEKVILQFGKVGKDVFTMDYRYPISAFQAFAICLTSFDTRIACE